MPRPRQFANNADRQAAYSDRCAEKVANVTPIPTTFDTALGGV
jgi:hypothetical protein